MDKRFWAFLMGVALVLFGIFFISNTNKADAPSDSASRNVPTSHTIGEGTSGVTLVEYGDFQCPACAQYYPLLKQVKEKYGDEITFQFRQFPLFQIHPNAIAAARASEAADMQGKFWEMHDLLYENQQAWSSVSNPQAGFEQYARTLDLDIEKFKVDYKGSVANDRIQADIKEGNRLNVESTPTFVINDKKISVPEPTLEGFSKIIDAEIAKQSDKKTETKNDTKPAESEGTQPGDESTAPDAASTEPAQ